MIAGYHEAMVVEISAPFVHEVHTEEAMNRGPTLSIGSTARMSGD